MKLEPNVSGGAVGNRREKGSQNLERELFLSFLVSKDPNCQIGMQRMYQRFQPCERLLGRFSLSDVFRTAVEEACYLHVTWNYSIQTCLASNFV